MINRDAASETRTHDSTGKHTDALIRSATATPFIFRQIVDRSNLSRKHENFYKDLYLIVETHYVLKMFENLSKLMLCVVLPAWGFVWL